MHALHVIWQFIKDHAWMPFFFMANGIGVCMIPLGLPGIWFQFAAALAVTVLTAWMGSPHLGWLWTAAVFLIAANGEVVDYIFGSLGYKHTKGSALASWTALVFGFCFGFLGVLIPIPIPVLGALIGSVVMSFVGTFSGAILGEIVHQKRLAAKEQNIEKKSHFKPALRVATGAIVGRALGIAAKLWFSFLAFCVAMAGLLWDIFMASR